MIPIVYYKNYWEGSSLVYTGLFELHFPIYS